MIYLVIILAVIARFIPHMPNAAPVTALAIFSAANLGWKKSFAITFAARLLSDIFLGFFAWPLMVAVYASHLVGILFGLYIKRSQKTTGGVILALSATEGEESQNRGSFGRLADSRQRPQDAATRKWLKIAASSLGASTIFFLVTNFAFLYSNYPHNLSGIALAYTNGLPFFKGTLLGDLGYTLALFGAYALIQALVKFRHYRLALEA